MTCCIACYDRATGTLEWTTAGHPYPLVRHNIDGTVDILDTTHGPPLGTSHHDHPYTHSERALEPGDLVVFYTDGLIELRNEDIATSADRLAAALSSINPGAENQAEHLYQAMRPTGLHSDDVAIVAINFAI